MARPKNSLILDVSKVKALRESKDLTQEVFVSLDAVELSLSAFQRIERGEAASREHAYQIAQALEVDLDDLLLRNSNKQVTEPDDQSDTLASFELAVLRVVRHPTAQRWIRAAVYFLRRMWNSQ